ncbi:isochorismate synthase [Dickeya dianthicola]|uniref:isochorismate synthase n=1 Tax=Dickeya dianthicola TaxID=204039 RepID=UPI001367EA07|nr:isochorismate synthase [Dickeya dianthicola]MCI4255270.1 isochorismate synthase [Dickeya dianthicola]MZG23767.1 isochorismate synthase [Dickeya dianthicola]MZI90142.1 isochorismate synthase [Dickeya dianthicola]
MSTLAATSSSLDARTLQHDDFLFLSPDNSLHARGCYAALPAAVADGGYLQGDVQQQVKALFARARQDGIARPLLVGAIPFDKRQPARLFVPQQSRWFARDALQHEVLPATPIRARQIREVPEHDTFCQMVSAGVAATRSGELNKIVLSRLLDIDTDQPLDSIRLLLQLNQQNPWSYNFHVPLEQGALLGASPELLLHKQGNHMVSQPLAGSARRSDDPVEDQRLRRTLMASAKDRHEHRLVTDDIQRVLAPRCRTLTIPDTPELLSTPVLWHLATRVQGEVLDPQENALSIACLLHPTPALCGVPFEAARDRIAQLEPFTRGLFGGIVGWCDDEGNGQWVVTIRCGEVRQNRVRLFAGAGIVPDSQPVSEWHETGVKLSTMLRAFGLRQDQECAA